MCYVSPNFLPVAILRKAVFDWKCFDNFATGCSEFQFARQLTSIKKIQCTSLAEMFSEVFERNTMIKLLGIILFCFVVE